ncbi:MAG: methyltransferase domain-containing protein [Bacteroidia bacterium]|nr:methyltransferase domain-containing protein [Bacteroidia bacterium]
MSAVRKFAYKELDQEGLETLETIAAAHRFNRWMFQTVAANLVPGNVLEVGSGIGNISREFLNAGYDLTVSDIRENYCGYLEENLTGYKNLRDIVKLDLVHPDFEKVYSPFLGKYDNLYALNVIEHIEDDILALHNCGKLVRPGGRIVILVPAYQSLYNKFDENLFHFRRYTRTTLSALFVKNKLPVLKAFHFNFIGILGWYFSGNILKKETIPSGQMNLYNKLVPIFRLIDRVVGRQVGLSVIVVGEVPGTSES